MDLELRVTKQETSTYFILGNSTGLPQLNAPQMVAQLLPSLFQIMRRFSFFKYIILLCI